MNLKAGDRLRIVLPLTKTGNALPSYANEQRQSATISLSANDQVGFATAHYEVMARRNGKVLLHFVAAEEIRDGKTMPQHTAPSFPFHLPEKPMYLRLVYLIRASTADHNMAIAGAKETEALENLTHELRQGTAACKQTEEVFCQWVPAGIAVRPES